MRAASGKYGIAILRSPLAIGLNQRPQRVVNPWNFGDTDVSQAVCVEQLPERLMDEGFISPGTDDSFFTSSPSILGRTEPQSLRSSSETSEPLSYPAALPQNGMQRVDTGIPLVSRTQRTSPSLGVSHASPIAPMRARDSAALAEMFDGDRLSEITLDIHRYLARAYPEPCWEDEPYEFLHGYV